MTAWQRAGEAARAAGDAEAVARIRERIAGADPDAALPEPEAAAAGADDDVEIDIDLGGSLEAEEDPTLAAEQDPLAAEEDPLAAEDDLDSLTIDLDALEPLGDEEPAPAPARPAAAGLSLTPDSPTATTPARVAEDLEEAEFYFEQGLLDESRAFYERILAAAPNHPQAMLRLGEIAARSGGPAPTVPAAAPPPAPLAPPPAAKRIEIAAPELEIDLGPELDLPDPDDDATPAPVEVAPPPEPVRPPAPPPAPPPRPVAAPAPAPVSPPAPAPPRMQAEVTNPSLEGIAAAADSGDFDLAAALAIGSDEPVGRTLAGTEEEAFEQVFDAFKTGVERQLGEGDHEARYDLGIAYKEMGLLDDAIAAFQLAMGAPERKLACLHMMGLCALDLGRAADAVAHLEQALSLPDLPSDQRVPLRYDAARAYGALGDVTRARAAFAEVRAADPDFGDVEQELARLANARPAGATGRAETYESFDDLLAETPVPSSAQRYESFDDLFGDDGDERPEPEAPEPAAAAEEPPPEPVRAAEPTPEPRRRRSGGRRAAARAGAVRPGCAPPPAQDLLRIGSPVEHLSTFGLTRDPFANEPQLDLFFESQSVRDTAARLRRSAQQGKGLVVLTAAGGVGKTMLVRHVLEGLEEEMFEACLLVPVPGVSDGAWVLDRLAKQLGVEAPSRERATVLSEVYDQLAIVREEGRHAVVILDEAQVLAEQGVLRELRGLLNLEYEERRLLTLVLVGLPALASAIADETGLADRVDVPLRLAPLTSEESSRYVIHRIRAAGGNPAIVESGAVAALVKWGTGVPRRLNRLADAALFEAHLAGRVSATAADVERAASELEMREPQPAAVAPSVEASMKLTAPEILPVRPAAPAPAPARKAAAPPPPKAAAAAPVRRAPARDLDAIFEEADVAIELEEVVATGTDPMRGAASETALIGDVSALDNAFESAAEPDATMALFADADEDDAGRRAIPLRGEDSGSDLDDLFADLVKEE